MNETIHTEEAYGRAMAQVARAENDRLARVMSGETMARAINSAPIEKRIKAFADACGTEGKTMKEVARVLCLPLSTVRTHCHGAMSAGAVHKVQPSRKEAATFYDARGED
jgi:DNA-binding NarL/FixJ family response regulator